jgi:hypothetical protein
MNLRQACIGTVLGCTIAACSSGSQGINVTAPLEVTAASGDPTPLKAGVDYTALADFSGYDNWVCDNASSYHPVTGALLAPRLVIIDNDGALHLDVTSNSIPHHHVGDFPNVGNPNRIDEVAVSYGTVRRVETEMPDRSSPRQAQIVGVSIGGIHFDPMTAEVYDNDRNSGWNYEALTVGAASNADLPGAHGYLGSDCNNAHVQPNGKYHYHGMPEELVSVLLIANGYSPDSPEMVLVGFAADGYPMYARYGYVDALDPSSGVVVMQGSYELKTGTRPSGPGGTYDGTFVQDWEYVEHSGDLDECNGRYGVTPEYPNGIFHYYVTDDYPFVQRCVWGEPTSDASHQGP